MNTLLLEKVWTWSDMFVMTLLGFSIVFVILVLLVFVMKAFGKMFGNENKPAAKAPLKPQPLHRPQPAQQVKAMQAPITTKTAAAPAETEMAAIAMALHLYFNQNIHDVESYRITNRQKGASAWNAKFFGINKIEK